MSTNPYSQIPAGTRPYAPVDFADAQKAADYFNSNKDVSAAYAKDGASMGLDAMDFAKAHYETNGKKESRIWGRAGSGGIVNAAAGIAPAPAAPAAAAPQPAPQSATAAPAKPSSGSYFDRYSDVSEAFKDEAMRNGMSEEQFSDMHFAKFGRSEGRTRDGAAASNPTESEQPAKAAVTNWSVTPNQTVKQQAYDIIKDDSPLMQQARSNAEQQMNARGLINSSMGIGAGQASVLNKAVEIGAQDANTYASSAQANAAAANSNAQFNTTATNAWNNQALDRTQQTDMANLQINATKELAGIESQYKNLTQASSSATSIVNGYSTNVQRILENDTLDAPAKQAAIDMQRTNTQNALKLIGALGEDLDLSAFLDEVLG